MQIKSVSAKVIREFGMLLAEQKHSEVIERLLTLLMQQTQLQRCVLVVAKDGRSSRTHLSDSSLVDESKPHFFVQAVANHGQEVVVKTTPLGSAGPLPIAKILQAFDEGHSSVQAVDNHTQAQVTPQCHSFACQLVGDPREIFPSTLFYCESDLPAAEFKRTLTELEGFWAFSELLLQQAVQAELYRQQAEQAALAEQALWASETYLNAILHHAPTLISVSDLDGNVVLASENFQNLESVGEEGCVGCNVEDIYPPNVIETLAPERAKAKSGETGSSEISLRHRDGSLHNYWLVKFPLRDKQDKIFGICSLGTDITERKRSQHALQEQRTRLNLLAFQDPLTGIPNRSLFYDRASHALARARRSHADMAVMLMDLDRFKYINDSLGHDAGDQLLISVSARLQEAMRDMDTVARLGGDEFVVVMEAPHDQEDVVAVANKLLSKVAEPLDIDGHDFVTSASMGISLYPRDGEDVDTLLKHAEVAMYQTKASGRKHFTFYRPGMSSTADNYVLLENDLRRAIETDQLTLYYQPQFSVQDGHLTGMEALVRWNHPDRGLISPADFIPLAEESGLIVELGDWVIREACRQQRQWQQQGLECVRVAINLSPKQLRESNFPQRVAEILQLSQVNGDMLEMEITETSAMEDAANTIRVMHDLSQMGIALAIDDFGTGYSSLAYLKRFPIQKLKIDRSFVRDVTTDSSDAAIARTMINLGYNMELKIVAEGVESEDQLQWLREHYCHQVQGFLLSRPLPAAEVQIVLERTNDLPSQAGSLS